MFLSRYLSSLRSTALFMTACGLFIGAVFPFYSAIFFGGKAFSVFYVIGCLVAGVLVGGFCYLLVRQVLKIQMERQVAAVRRIAPAAADLVMAGASDEMESLLEGYAQMLSRIVAIAENGSRLATELRGNHHDLINTCRSTASGNEQQAEKITETFQALEEMNGFFNELLKNIEDLAQRTEERASISTEMSATTDSIAQSVTSYSTSVLETSASIEEMVMSIKETSVNIEALAASTEQTSASIRQIGTAISGVRDNAQRTADSSEKVRLEAQEGMKAVATTTAAMLEIEESSNASFSAIKRLALSTARIGDFLDIIKDLVEQTNLLSLNASIIAAQAGARGKAFTVVAEEVRALAHRTSASTKEIEELVKNIQKETGAVEKAVTLGKEKVAEGVKKAAGANNTLKGIEESAAEASQMVQKIAMATVEQAGGSRLISDEAEKNLIRVQQVTKAMQELERGTNAIVSTLEQMRSLSQKITTSTQEQARGNRLYLKSVLDDNDRVKNLRETSIQQIMMGDVVLNDVRVSRQLMEANAEETRRIIREVEGANTLVERLQAELEVFGAGPSPLLRSHEKRSEQPVGEHDTLAVSA